MSDDSKKRFLFLITVCILVALSCSKVQSWSPFVLIEQINCEYYEGGEFVPPDDYTDNPSFFVCKTPSDPEEVNEGTKMPTPSPELEEGVGITPSHSANVIATKPDPHPTETSGPAPVEECLADPDTYSWEITDYRFEEGDGWSHCAYHLTIENFKEPGQYLSIYTVRKNSEYEGWFTRNLAAFHTYERGNHITENYDKGEITSWMYATKFLMIKGTDQCEWLIEDEAPSNKDLWEQHAIELDNPCK